MFNAICILAVGLIAAYSTKEYKLVSVIMFLEFMLHEIAAQGGLIETRILNPVLIYLVYMMIQTGVLFAMFLFQLHPVLALIVFINLSYNFFTILQHVGLFFYWPNGSYIDFHGGYRDFAQMIMLLELIYLLGITAYVGNYVRKHKFLDIDRIDRMFFIRRRFFDGDLA